MKEGFTYARPQFGISLTHKINFTVLIYFIISKQRKCQCGLNPHFSQLAEEPSYVAGSKDVDDFNNQRYCYICLTTV